MPLITDKEYESMTLWDWTKMVVIISTVLAIIIFASGCVTLPRCMTC